MSVSPDPKPSKCQPVETLQHALTGYDDIVSVMYIVHTYIIPLVYILNIYVISLVNLSLLTLTVMQENTRRKSSL
jgi:hypothetical protein